MIAWTKVVTSKKTEKKQMNLRDIMREVATC